jgi:cobalamin biosynthesis protein CobD/CbiB
MALHLFLIWYFLIGLLLGNGMPHFVFGAARKIFRSPFGRRSKPKVNIAWGLANLFLATVISAGLTVYNMYSGYSLIALLLGFWLTVLMFGTRIKEFLSD